MAARPFERTLIVKPAPEQTLSPGYRQGTLTVLSGPGMGAMVVLDSASVIIGRGESANLRIEDAGVSRRHACVWQNGGQFEIEDLGSSNGTFLENGRVSGRTELRDGARIGIGGSVLRFSLQDEVEQAASKRLYQLSVRDGLTGLYNRRHFDERLGAELAFSLRHGTALSLILIDVDHFKRINDTVGHQAGDAVLQQIGDVLQRSVRTEDVVARYGGEEFAVIARGIDAAGAKAFAERIRVLIATTKIMHAGATIAVTASLGLAHCHWGSLASKTTSLVAAADHALYSAKHAGRNRVVVASIPNSPLEATQRNAQQQNSNRRPRTWDQPTHPATTKTPRE
jgi:diguanylate cyclase (GGDEF)-like protein